MLFGCGDGGTVSDLDATFADDIAGVAGVAAGGIRCVFGMILAGVVARIFFQRLYVGGIAAGALHGDRTFGHAGSGNFGVAEFNGEAMFSGSGNGGTGLYGSAASADGVAGVAGGAAGGSFLADNNGVTSVVIGVNGKRLYFSFLAVCALHGDRTFSHAGRCNAGTLNFNSKAVLFGCGNFTSCGIIALAAISALNTGGAAGCFGFDCPCIGKRMFAAGNGLAPNGIAEGAVVQNSFGTGGLNQLADFIAFCVIVTDDPCQRNIVGSYADSIPLRFGSLIEDMPQVITLRTYTFSNCSNTGGNGYADQIEAA